ncbi:hypothetical protein NKJ40_29655 [Mesorhizobium sp. M0119]|uniref:hypothetical protein n=1 Tax=Mesorhizobium sp. M0119 TaxID=2956885 RepID=UPI003339F607
MAAPTSAVWPGIHIPSSADVAVTVQSKAMAVALAKHFKFEFMLMAFTSHICRAQRLRIIRCTNRAK